MRKGSALIEVLGGLALISITIVAVIELSNKSTSNAGLATRQSEATNYARSKIEEVRAEKDASDWTTYCASWTGTETETQGEFTRRTTVVCGTDTGKDNMIVHTEVEWYERGTSKKATQEVTFIRR